MRTRLTLAVLLFAAAPAAAQVVPRLDVGTGAVRYGARPGASLLELAPALAWDAGPARLDASARTGLVQDGLGRAEASLRAAGTASLFGIFRPELRLDGTSDDVMGGATRRRLEGGIRLQAGDESRGLWIGLGTGRFWHGPTGRAQSTLGGGAWLRAGAAQVRVSYSVVDFGRAADLAALGLATYSDANAELAWRRGALELGATMGRRFGGAMMAGETWGGGSASLRLTQGTSLLLRHEIAPADPALHLPRRTFSTFGIRLDGGRPAIRREVPAVAAVRLAVRGRRQVIEVEAPGAQVVEVSGSFSQWVPMLLAERGQGRFVLPVELEAGLHRLNLRIDGGPWEPPPGLPVVEDEFAGTTGVLLVQ